MDVDAVLLSVQERDKWRHRLAVLQGTLKEVRERRGRLEGRLRRIKRELVRLTRFADAVLDQTARVPASRAIHAAEVHPPTR
jgi:hypothetical protein